ncbi:MAG: hypothetical protein NZ902_03870 [Acidilobaceae archaeon]|nr:hypothetical protein [Acidilobaceae archaeon]MCX8165133.1 hypothetical protein [Acidilobaceae archaeon]MDW7974351.1 hypothetical protein [Sulfolobales archaeon]
MPKISKVILDTAEHHPLHKDWLKLAKALSQELGAELEVISEDYVFAMEHGETDDLGMAWLPQLFARLEDGSVRLILSRYPFDPHSAKPNEQLALEEARRRVQEISQ